MTFWNAAYLKSGVKTYIHRGGAVITFTFDPINRHIVCKQLTKSWNVKREE